MRITDNMLRIISHAYLNNTSAVFLIKSGLYDATDDEEFLTKAYLTVSLLANVTINTTSSSEDSFFHFLDNTAAYGKKLRTEREIDSNLVTVKEFIAGNGLVYSDFLGYIYIKLTKYEVRGPKLEQLKKSLDTTYAKLIKINNIQAISLDNYTMFDLLTELAFLDDFAKKIEIVVANRECEYKSFKKVMETIKDQIHKLTNKIDQTQDALYDNDYKAHKDVVVALLDKEINTLQKRTLENHTESILKELEERVRKTNYSKVDEKELDYVLNTIEKLTKNVDTTLDELNLLKLNTKLKFLDDSINNLSEEVKEEKETRLEQEDTSSTNSKTNQQQEQFNEFNSMIDNLDNYL